MITNQSVTICGFVEFQALPDRVADVDVEELCVVAVDGGDGGGAAVPPRVDLGGGGLTAVQPVLDLGPDEDKNNIETTGIPSHSK